MPIPGLVTATNSVDSDVVVRFGKPPACAYAQQQLDRIVIYTSPRLAENGKPLLVASRLCLDNFYSLHYYDETRFIVSRSGDAIWVDGLEHFSLEYVVTYLLGPVLAFALRLRGTFSLHSSVVVYHEHAFALVGDAGAGKSTTAAAFAQRGYEILTDDVAAIRVQDHVAYVLPGYPRIRLWNESVKILFGEADTLPLIAPDWDKRYLALDENGFRFASNLKPLKALFVLQPRSSTISSPIIERASLRDALMLLIANSYVNYLLDARMRAHEFELFSDLVQYVTVYQVTPPADSKLLPTLCDAILTKFSETMSGAIA